MKKPVSIILSTLMLASALTACAPAQDQLDPAITLASSDAQTKATWLDDRLDVIPDDVILGIGSNSAYGIDMSNFEDDGYIARAIDGEVLLFGKTVNGLDRAVRQYAKAADRGATAELDTVYHEGVRIKKLTIDGRDISEFKIVYAADPYGREMKAPNRFGKTPGNAQYAAGELSRLINKATGITLEVTSEEGDFPMIKIDYIPDVALGDNSFNYKVENGNLYINGAPDANGCANGVHYFLQQECGWDGLLARTDSFLNTSDHVEVPEGASAAVEPLFDYFNFSTLSVYSYRNDREYSSFNYIGIIPNAWHGIQWDYTVPTLPGGQMCYTSEDNYLSLFDQVYTNIINKENAGMVIGEDFLYVDLSQPDYPNYCMCKDCAYIYYREEGEAHSGAMIRFLNRFAEEMEAEGKGGLKYLTFAYYGSNVPPQTAVHPDVWVTYCFDGNCTNHPLDGSECGYLPLQSHPMDFEPNINNTDFDEWLRGWMEKCENVYLWHYALPQNFGNYTYYQNVYKDMMYLKDIGLKGMYLESEYNGYGFSHLRTQLVSTLVWQPELTEDEYNVIRDSIMKREYGDGYGYIRDYIGILEETEQGIGCFDCWGFGVTDIFNTKNWDTEIFYSRAEECIDLLEMAIKETSTDLQEKFIKALLVEVLYRQCAIGYFTAYDAGDTDTIAALEEKYQLCLSYGNEFFGSTSWWISFNERFTPQPTLADEAWLRWNHERASLLPEGAVTSAMPEKWAEWYATSETTTVG